MKKNASVYRLYTFIFPEGYLVAELDLMQHKKMQSDE